MDRADNNLSLLIGVPGLILQAIGPSAIGGSLGSLVTLVGTAMLIAGLCFYSRGKGYHMAFGLLGLLSCLGLLILAVMPDKRK